MEFKNEALETSFTVPDEITVGTRLDYLDAVGFSSNGRYFRRSWKGAKTIIEEWESKLLPDMNVDIDTLGIEVKDENGKVVKKKENTKTVSQVTSLLIWASSEVANHMSRQDDVDPNS
jgi:hypothetical protein